MPSPGLNTQTQKKSKVKTPNIAKPGDDTKAKGAFADPYEGKRWIPRWVSIPAQLITLGIIFYSRKTALEDRVAEMQEPDDAAETGADEAEAASTIGDSLEAQVAEALRSANPTKRTSNIRANDGSFEKWRYVNDNEVWDETHYEKWLPSDRCNIPKVRAADLSREEFEAVYLDKKPVIIIGATDTSAFAAAVQKAALLNRYGNYSVTLSSANKNSYEKQESQLLYYVDEIMSKPQTLEAKGNETWYHFGDNKHDEWKAVFNLYEQPKKYIYGPYASLSFGLGSSGSGVPFHTHGHVLAEVFTGQKRWWLAPPKHEPLFGPDATSLSWLNEVYPFMMSSEDSDASEEEREAFSKLTERHLKAAAKGNEKIYTTDHGKEFALTAANARRFPPNPPYFYECTVGKGEMLYIPGLWWHSTLNIGQTVFMSVFV